MARAGIGLAVLLGLPGCVDSSSQAAGSLAPPPLTILAEPGALAAGASREFRAVGADGAPHPVDWTVDGGSLVDAKQNPVRFLATAQGTFELRAASRLDPRASARAEVEVAPYEPSFALGDLAPGSDATPVGGVALARRAERYHVGEGVGAWPATLSRRSLDGSDARFVDLEPGTRVVAVATDGQGSLYALLDAAGELELRKFDAQLDPIGPPDWVAPAAARLLPILAVDAEDVLRVGLDGADPAIVRLESDGSLAPGPPVPLPTTDPLRGLAVGPAGELALAAERELWLIAPGAPGEMGEPATRVPLAPPVSQLHAVAFDDEGRLFVAVQEVELAGAAAGSIRVLAANGESVATLGPTLPVQLPGGPAVMRLERPRALAAASRGALSVYDDCDDAELAARVWHAAQGAPALDARLAVTPRAAVLSVGWVASFEARVFGALAEVEWEAAGGRLVDAGNPARFVTGVEPGVFRVRCTSDAEPALPGWTDLRVCPLSYELGALAAPAGQDGSPVMGDLASGGGWIFLAYRDPFHTGGFVARFAADGAPDVVFEDAFSDWSFNRPDANVAVDAAGNGYWLDRGAAPGADSLFHMDPSGAVSEHALPAGLYFTDRNPGGALGSTPDGILFALLGPAWPGPPDGVYRLELRDGALLVELAFAHAFDAQNWYVEVDPEGRILLPADDTAIERRFADGAPDPEFEAPGGLPAAVIDVAAGARGLLHVATADAGGMRVRTFDALGGEVAVLDAYPASLEAAFPGVGAALQRVLCLEAAGAGDLFWLDDAEFGHKDPPAATLAIRASLR